MVRPREGGFCYTQAEFDTALEDAKLLLSHGADGLVFGFLHQDGTLDVERTRIMAELARDAGRESVFHRAIDVTPDWRAALDVLMELGVARVLTSGQQASVPLGADTIRQMGEYAAGRIEILPGGGVNATVKAVAGEHYRYGVLNTGGQFPCGEDLLMMKRVRIDRGLSVDRFASLIK